MGPTALLPFRRKACWGFFRPINPKASAGFEPVNLSTKGQHFCVILWILYSYCCVYVFLILCLCILIVILYTLIVILCILIAMLCFVFVMYSYFYVMHFYCYVYVFLLLCYIIFVMYSYFYVRYLNAPIWGVAIHEHKKRYVWATKGMIGTLQISRGGGGEGGRQSICGFFFPKCTELIGQC